MRFVKRIIRKLRFAAYIVVLVALVGCCSGYNGPESNHFDGAQFFNPEGGDHTFGDTVKWLWDMDTADWPEWVDNSPQPAPPKRVDDRKLRVTYINHATVLIQLDGINILTDPIWSTRAGPVSWLGVKRVRSPGISFDQLPPIHIVLISHDHYDHLDLPTIKRLEARDGPIYLTGLGVKEIVETAVEPTRVRGLDWWDTVKAGPDTPPITFVPARHGSGRRPFGGNRTLWGGFVIDSPHGQVYYAGDSGYGRFAKQIASAFTNMRLAILPIGSYEKRWFMKAQHMNPNDAVKFHRLLKVRQSMGMHYSTFAEHPEQTIGAHEEDLAAALRKQSVRPERFWVLGFGEGRSVRPISQKQSMDAENQP